MVFMNDKVYFNVPRPLWLKVQSIFLAKNPNIEERAKQDIATHILTEYTQKNEVTVKEKK